MRRLPRAVSYGRRAADQGQRQAQVVNKYAYFTFVVRVLFRVSRLGGAGEAEQRTERQAPTRASELVQALILK